MKTIGLCMVLSLAHSYSAYAQDIKLPKATFPIYASLQTASNRYEVYYKNIFTTPGVIKLSPWLLTAGCYLRPRLAVQTSLSYSSNTFDAPGSIGTNSAGQTLIEYITHDESQHLAVPVLIRYSL